MLNHQRMHIAQMSLVWFLLQDSGTVRKRLRRWVERQARHCRSRVGLRSFDSSVRLVDGTATASSSAFPLDDRDGDAAIFDTTTVGGLPMVRCSSGR